jgi:hypothetical protein
MAAGAVVTGTNSVLKLLPCGMESVIEALTVFLAMMSVGFVSFMDVLLFGGIV